MPDQPLTVRGRGTRFLLTGILVNATLFLVLHLLLVAGLDYRLAVTGSYALGMIWGYVQNRLWSWQSRAPVFRSARRYVAVYGAVYLLHLVFVMLLVDLVGLPPLLAALASSVFLIIPVFLALDRLVFATKSHD